MKNLLIDTACHDRIVAVLEDDQILAFKQELNDHTLSSSMVPMIQETLEEAKIEPSDIDTIYIVTGPGSFTGIRVGVTIAKTYAWALSKKIVPLSELELLATTPFVGDYIIPYIDARRDYGYTGIYDHTGKVIMKDSHISRENLLKTIPENKKVVFVSNDEIDVPYDVLKPQIDISKMIRRHKMDPGVNPHECNPNYLKMTEAEENLLKHDHD